MSLSEEEFLKNWHELDELVLVDPRTVSKEERERMDALTVAAFKANRAERALEAAQKNALEATAEYTRLRVLDEIAYAQKEAKRNRRTTARRSA